MTRALTREESKLITRHRLLDSALHLLAENGYGALTASAVAREAGIAQPTFYVHFKDKNELLKTLAAEKIGALRESLREARRRVSEGAGVEAIRDTFRLPLKTLTENPELFRIYVQEFSQPASPFGEQARRLYEELRRDLAEDLAGFGVPVSTPAERQRAEMMAEAMIAQTQALGMGYIDGRYTDLEEMVEVLTRFAVGALMMSSVQVPR